LLDQLYSAVAARGRRWFERHPEARRRLQQPVIAVGNLSLGGTGKTPLVRQIVDWLIDCGERPAVLSRGYKRRTVQPGVTVVSDGAALLAGIDEAGDEPLMLARQLSGAIVCVCEDRHLAGVIAERVLGATVHVLDDGFQHVQLARDFDILVTSAGEISSQRVLPFGRLRESKDAGARAHFLVVVGADESAARAEAWDLGISAHSAARRRLGDSRTAATSDVVAVAGIARPEQFFEMLPAAGYRVKETVAFADHHRYTAADVARIARTLEGANAQMVVTTEKDAVRFQAIDSLPFQLCVVPLELELAGWDALTTSLWATIDRVRCAR
jgi:tetraacyldisaccharide 4'-kinase